MANALSAVASLVSLAALILVAISIATNYWVKIDLPRSDEDDVYNPSEQVSFVNTTLTIKYDLDYFGMWVGCHRDERFNQTSCGYIGSSCRSEICWVLNEQERACNTTKVTPVSKCAGYQATRAFAIMGVIFLILGCSLLCVSICVASRNITAFGSYSTFFAGILLMIAFAVFQGNVFSAGNLSKIGKIGYSFVLFIIAWPLTLLAAVVGFIASVTTSKEGQRFEETD